MATATMTRTHRMTANEFYNDPSVPERAELVDGEVVELTPPPPVHVWILANVSDALNDHVRAHKLGRVFGDGSGYTLGAYKVRVPDVSYFSAARLPVPPPTRGGWPYAPDLAVEVLSPSERHDAIRKKPADYFGAGGRMMWLVDAGERGVEVYAPDAAPLWMAEGGTVAGGDVVPGFTRPVADVFAGVPREG